MKQGVARHPGRVRVGAHQVLRAGQGAGINRILHQAPLEIKPTRVDRQREHSANRDHGQRHHHDGLSVATPDADQHSQYSDRIDEPAVITNWVPVKFEIIPVIGANR